MLDAAALDFAVFSNKLATALHASGRRLGLDLSGDSDRPIGVFPAFGAHAKDVDYFTLMSTCERSNGRLGMNVAATLTADCCCEQTATTTSSGRGTRTTTTTSWCWTR